MAQTLIMIQFGAEFLGILTTLPIPYVSCFAEGPWHQLVSALAFSMVLIASLQLAKLGGATFADQTFLASWACLMGVWAFSTCLIDVTVTAYVRVEDRNLVAGRTRLAAQAGIPFG